MEVNDVVKKKVSEILLDPDNPNVMTEDEMQRLRNSMEKYGFLFPIIIDQKNQIVDGEHRYRIFKEKRSQGNSLYSDAFQVGGRKTCLTSGS